MWINGGFFVFRREVFDYIQEGDDLPETLNRLIADRELSPTSTTASGRRWTRSRTASASRAWSAAARRLAGLGDEPSGEPRASRAEARPRARARAARACSRSARTPTTSRSAAAARSCGSPREVAELELTWVVLSARGRRAPRRRAPAPPRSARPTVEVEDFEDAFFRYGREVKEHFEELKERVSPDLVLTHHGSDLHQDHRLVAELTWNTFRDHLILEYEIPKYDGDLGAPNVFVPLDEALARREGRGAARSTFRSQALEAVVRRVDLFLALLRLRGMECRSPSGLAEAFYARKLVV